MGLVEFTQPGYDVRPVTKAAGSQAAAHRVPEAKFSIRADMIIAIEAAAEPDDFTTVRASIEKWEVTESYEDAMALWREGLTDGRAKRVPDEEHVVTGTAGSIPLTRCEAAVMVALTESPNVMVPFASIAERIWGRQVSDEHDRAAIRTHVHTLRRKMEEAGSPDRIVVIAGVGYKIVAATTAGQAALIGGEA